MQLLNTHWRHNSDGTGSSLPIPTNVPLALWIKSWLTQPFLEYSLSAILNAFLNISMECESDFVRKRVATLKMEDWRCLLEEVTAKLRSGGQEPPRPRAFLLVFAYYISCTCRNVVTLLCSLPQFFIYFPTRILFLPGESFLSSPLVHIWISSLALDSHVSDIRG